MPPLTSVCIAARVADFRYADFQSASGAGADGRGSAEGGSGPLVTHFAAHAGQLPCPLYLVPGGLSRDEIDALA